MTADTTRPGWERRLNTAVRWGLKHWLLFANGLVLLYLGIPLLAPLAHAAGYHWLGAALFAIYAPLCHQEPKQSFFVFGYQMGFCQRETAMYGFLLLGGVLFALLRDRVRPISVKLGALLLLPMLLDGGSQLIDDLLGNPVLRGLNDSLGSFNFWMRMFTGLLFAIAVVLTVYPRLERDLKRAQVA